MDSENITVSNIPISDNSLNKSCLVEKINSSNAKESESSNKNPYCFTSITQNVCSIKGLNNLNDELSCTGLSNQAQQSIVACNTNPAAHEDSNKQQKSKEEIKIDIQDQNTGSINTYINNIMKSKIGIFRDNDFFINSDGCAGTESHSFGSSIIFNDQAFHLMVHNLIDSHMRDRQLSGLNKLSTKISLQQLNQYKNTENFEDSSLIAKNINGLVNSEDETKSSLSENSDKELQFNSNRNQLTKSLQQKIKSYVNNKFKTWREGIQMSSLTDTVAYLILTSNLRNCF